mgnify:CR=1 FL=1
MSDTEFPEVEFIKDFDYYTTPSSFVAYKTGLVAKIPREHLKAAREAGVVRNAVQEKPVGPNPGKKA